MLNSIDKWKLRDIETEVKKVLKDLCINESEDVIELIKKINIENDPDELETLYLYIGDPIVEVVLSELDILKA